MPDAAKIMSPKYALAFRKAVCCLGAATLTAYYLATTLFIIIGNLRGHNIVLTFNQYGEGLPELAFTLISLPLVAYFILESKKAINRSITNIE